MRRIIFNWYYDRPDLTEYLLQIFGDTELYFLFHGSKKPVPEYLKKYPNVFFIYWYDYLTPYQLIRSINPDAIVFHDIESFHQVGLNIAAKNLSILTFILQHGLRSDWDIKYVFSKSYSTSKVSISRESFKTAIFFLSSLQFRNLWVIPTLFRFSFYRKSYDLTIALKKVQFPLRNADYYIELSEINTTFHKERDNIPSERFVITGNPIFDGYFTSFAKSDKIDETESYALLIDCPFETDNGIDIPLFSLQQKNDYIRQICNLSKEEDCFLKVKLHPKSYKTRGLVEDKNLVYCLNDDIVELAKGARYVVFVHYSSITPVLLLYKRSVYINLGGDVQKILFDTVGVEGYTLDDIRIHKLQLDKMAKPVSFEKLEKLIFKVDGKSALRVRNAILEKIELHKTGK